MTENRPNPDELLARIKADEAGSRRGSLRIFFGYAAGVGKTFAMLKVAHAVAAEGRDVVVGYVEPHARPETEALVQGLETIPTKSVTYRNVTIQEFDVDAAIDRKPEILLIDELAHSNAEGSRHRKRWQDVEECLGQGIDVWTTLNVQHIESLNDVVGRITGVFVRETVPDKVFDMADELTLADITPEDLIARLESGKVYVSTQARLALESFFRKSNLSALREMSLRQAARRIRSDVESLRLAADSHVPWATAERLLVCVGPSPTTARVIRTAKRLAAALDADWLAVAVDAAGEPTASARSRSVSEHFRLAERLGAETVTLAGAEVAKVILEYARIRNVTKILIGKTRQPLWRKLLFGTVVDEILENADAIDVYVIHGDEPEPKERPDVRSRTPLDIKPYLAVSAAVVFAGAIAMGVRRIEPGPSEANWVMFFLASVAWAAYRYGRGPAVWASVLAVILFDVLFVAPVGTLAISDFRYAFTFAVMLSIGLVISDLTSRLKAQVENTRERERRTSALYEMGKRLSSLYGSVFLVNAAGSKFAELVGGEAAVYLKSAAEPHIAYGMNNVIARHPLSTGTAKWCMDHDQPAGAGTNTLPSAAALFLPLVGSQQTLGAIALSVPDVQKLLEPEQRRFLEACASQLAMALERDALAIEAAEARVQAETEKVRSTLLSSVSHDIKTPLSAISGAADSLIRNESSDESTRKQLLETISDEAARLHRLLENILQMSRLDAGAIRPNLQWHVLEEIVGSALHRTKRELKDRPVRTNIPADMPLVLVDGLLTEQLFVNLLENAARYAGKGKAVTISAAIDGPALRIVVADEGPGLPKGSEDAIFEKFYRASPLPDSGQGTGLGLAICRAIARTHGGSITARNRVGVGGAEFEIRLPLGKNPPNVRIE
jgi:two-component system sensor histidine kinase KdpD